MPALQPDHIRQALRRLGSRRTELVRREEILKRDTRKALKQAKGVVPMNEAARLVGLGRATVYQDYLE